MNWCCDAVQTALQLHLFASSVGGCDLIAALIKGLGNQINGFFVQIGTAIQRSFASDYPLYSTCKRNLHTL
mgnify:CR=1 FL=1